MTAPEKVLKKMPAGLGSVGQVMSCHDSSIRYDADAKLRTGKTWGTFAAEDFTGKVWFDPANGMFCCEVFAWSRHIDTVEEANLADLMAETVARWSQS